MSPETIFTLPVEGTHTVEKMIHWHFWYVEKSNIRTCFSHKFWGKQIGHNQTILVQSRRQKWHGASCPTSNGILVMLDLLEFMDWQPAEAMVEACHREPVWGMKIVIFASRFLAPFTHSHGAMPACLGAFFLASYSLHQTRGWCRVGRVPELHNKSSHGVCSFCGQPLGADDDMVTKPGEKSETLRKMVVRTNHKHNVLTRNGTIFQENLMCESADADVIFAVSWLSCLRLFNSFLLLVC